MYTDDNGNIYRSNKTGELRKLDFYEVESLTNPAKTNLEIALAKIAELESKQTPRRLREAALGDADSVSFLQDIDDKISLLRKSIG